MLLRPWQATAGRWRPGNWGSPEGLVVTGDEGADDGDVIPDECGTGTGGFAQTLRDQR